MALSAQQHHCSLASAYCEVTVDNGAHHVCFWDECGLVLQLQAVLLPQSPHMAIYFINISVVLSKHL